MNRTLASALLLVAAVAGILHGRREYARDRGEARAAEEMAILAEAREKAKQLEEAPPLPAPSLPPEPARERAAPAAPRPAAPAPSAEDRARARRLIDDAERAHAAGRYQDEASLYRQAAELLAHGDDVECTALRKLASRRAARAKVIQCLASRVAPNEFASGQGLTRIVFFDHESIARVVSQDGKRVLVKQASGLEQTVDLAAVKKVEPCPPEEWRRRVERGLAERREKVDEQSPLELYGVAYYCLENGLEEEARPYLDRAFERDRDQLLVRTFCTGPDRPSDEDLRLARALVGPAPGPAVATAAAPAPPGGATPAAPLGPAPAGSEDEGVPAPAPETAVLADPGYRALCAKLDEGRAHYRLTFGAGPQADAEMRATIEIFDRAFAILGELQAKYPDSEELGRRLTEINLVRADLHKRARVAR
jgi:hypothetical protein